MRTLLVIILSLLSLTALAQSKTVKTKNITRNRDIYVEKYSALASDTSVKHGTYKLLYKGKVIETGDYKKGERIGPWTFYNLKDEVEFIYDYDKNLPFQIMPHYGSVYSAKQFPSLFLGSPLIPYHFIARSTYYPVKESGNKRDCKVVLALEINANGRMTGYHLETSSRDDFNRVVLDAASRIPKHWRWVPAREGGRNIPSNYRITLIFEAVD
ncbi:MAG: energy transducer TonB [Bacteroidales bacterium]|nr:energy transducer TonB [Bacteroidales bacterium]